MIKILNKKRLDEYRIVNWLKNFAKSNFILKCIGGFIIWVIALIPTWLYLLIRWLIGPESFWQELALFVIGVIVIGWLQIILIAAGVFLTILITDESNGRVKAKG